jgi:glycosyltransferase involved in cell wall biosynthesis
MLSILIPAYNYDITRLVRDLHRQATDLSITFEIIVMEDGSTDFLDKNKEISTLQYCNYIVLEKNIGRSAIRNKLADAAKYNALLFLDCDAEISSPFFIKRYLPFCKTSCVVIGGTAYEASNNNPSYSLRLSYGKKREARSASEREKHKSFSTFNFLVSSDVLKKIRFNEDLKGYGHEDTLFGYELRKAEISIYQIDNPAIHKGLDNNAVFLKKTGEAVVSLLNLYRTGNYPFIVEESKLLRAYIRIKKVKGIDVCGFMFSIFQPYIEKKLLKQRPSLKLYDLYKLGFLCELSRKK